MQATVNGTSFLWIHTNVHFEGRADKTDTEETQLRKATSSQSSSRKLGKNTAAVRNRLCEPNQDRFCIKQFNVKEQCFNIIMAFSAVWDSVLFTLISGLFFLWIEFVQANPRGRGGNTAGSGSVGMFCFFLLLLFVSSEFHKIFSCCGKRVNCQVWSLWTCTI